MAFLSGLAASMLKWALSKLGALLLKLGIKLKKKKSVDTKVDKETEVQEKLRQELMKLYAEMDEHDAQGRAIPEALEIEIQQHERRLREISSRINGDFIK